MKPTLTDGTEKKWAVFVGGMEVNNFLMQFIPAERLGLSYLTDGYDDVVLYRYDTAEEVRIV